MENLGVSKINAMPASTVPGPKPYDYIIDPRFPSNAKPRSLARANDKLGFADQAA